MTPELASSLFETIPMPIILIGTDQTIAAMNQPAERLVGGHMRGRHYITALRQPNLLDKIERTIETGESQHARYLGREAERETIYQVQISSCPLGAVLAFTDKTADEDIGQLRRDFVANVSHELRTPLTALSGFIETLRGPAKSDPIAQDRFLSIMDHEAGRMTRLVDDLLSLSRVEAEGRVRPTEPVVLSNVLSETISNLEPVLDQAGATLDIDDQSNGAAVAGDTNQLRQVVSNLIENAAKYGKRDGTIHLTITPPTHEPQLRAEGIRLVVRDEGQGIAPHHLARLTERFYRVDSHRSREVGGTGLGLAIVKHIINRHRGRLQIDSVEGEGSIFSVILPVFAGNDVSRGGLS